MNNRGHKIHQGIFFAEGDKQRTAESDSGDYGLFMSLKKIKEIKGKG